MKFSVITTSFNQACWIGKNLQSVSDQSYTDHEHIILDPGSTDGSREIIDDFANRDSRIIRVYEPDRGQVDAINKGFEMSSGGFLTWLNSDDFYHDNSTLKAVYDNYIKFKAPVIYGRGWRVDADGKKLSEAFTHPDDTDFSETLQSSIGILQPSLFFAREVYNAIGGLNEKYNLQLDYEYWIRMAHAGYPFKKVNAILSHATVHANAKSTGQRLAQLNECLHLMLESFGDIHNDWLIRYAEYFVTRQDQKTNKKITKDDDQEYAEKVICKHLRTYISSKLNTRLK